MSRARHGSYLYATASQAAELVERPHSDGIPLPAEHADELDFDVHHAVASPTPRPSPASTTRSCRPSPASPTSTTSTGCGTATSTSATPPPNSSPTATPTPPAARCASPRPRPPPVPHLGNTGQRGRLGQHRHRHRRHRQHRHRPRRVHLHRRQRRTRKILEWADIRPVNHPEPADTTPESDAYFDLAQAALDEHAADWTAALAAHGIHPDESHLLPAAIAMRRQRLTLALAAEAPGWLTYWYGPRPTDPAGAQVWDDEISQLASSGRGPDGWRPRRPPDALRQGEP